MSNKRTLHSFFGPTSTQTAQAKKSRLSFDSITNTDEPSSESDVIRAKIDTINVRPVKDEEGDTKGEETSEEEPPAPPSTHSTYPFPIPALPTSLANHLAFSPYDPGRAITDAPDLDLLYYHPYVAPQASSPLFKFLRSTLPFYRVVYSIKRGSVETTINTPRFTTVFGLDETGIFSPDDPNIILDAKTKRPLPSKAYSCHPRPIPSSLDALRILTEASTGHEFNFCLVNYYATGSDSISYHSDDERFLGPEPAIASFSLGGTRDFLLRHKPPAPSMQQGVEWEAVQAAHAKPRKYELSSGDMVLMRGRTQGCWLHSIPKRAGKGAEKGRINITFRRAMVRGGTENYYRYNVGTGPVHVWSEIEQGMVEWNGMGRGVDGVVAAAKNEAAEGTKIFA